MNFETDSDSISRYSFVVTCIGGLVVFSSFGLIMAALPAKLAFDGWSTIGIGFIVSGHAIGAIAFRIFGLRFIDRVGSRRGARSAALAGIFACLLLPTSMFMTNHYLMGAILFLSKIGHGCALACFITAGLTSAANSRRADMSAKNIGVYSGTATLGLLIGPPLGLFLQANFTFWFVLLLPSICMLMALFFCPPDQRTSSSEIVQSAKVGTQYQPNLKINKLILIALALAAILQGGAEAHLPAIIATFDATSVLFSVYIAFGFSIATAKLACGYIIVKVGNVPTINLGLLLLLPAFSLPFLFDVNSAILILSSFFMGSGSGLIGTAAVTKVSAETSPDARGTAIGICALTQEAGLASGAVIFGVILYVIGPVNFYPVGLALTVITLAGINYRRISVR